MILEWFNKRLTKRLNQKKQDVTKLRWQQAKLQRQLDMLKKHQEEQK